MTVNSPPYYKSNTFPLQTKICENSSSSFFKISGCHKLLSPSQIPRVQSALKGLCGGLWWLLSIGWELDSREHLEGFQIIFLSHSSAEATILCVSRTWVYADLWWCINFIYNWFASLFSYIVDYSWIEQKLSSLASVSTVKRTQISWIHISF